MTTRNAAAASAVLVGAVFLYTAVVYPSLPDLIPIHWNLRGQVDGWAPKQWGAWLLPGTALLMLGMQLALPVLSPRGFTVQTFRSTFNYLMVLMAGLFGFLQVIALQAALHPEWESGKALVAGIFLFLGLIGNLLGKVRRNYWIGVRTPWTLASERVWNETHRLAARLLFAVGLGGALAVWVGVPVPACFVALMAAVLVPVVHSLVLYKRLEREGSL